MKRCLQTLHWFYQVSGLKINITKTKVIRIGPIRETDRRYCKENNLEWVSEFTALGITYNVLDLANITVSNINEKVKSMKKIMQDWIYRNITPTGRVCIVKSLVMSKIIHVLQALPTPPEEFFKSLETLFINFIWKNKRHEINKKLVCETIENGGLNLISLQEMDLGLKLTWIRKVITKNPDWLDFAIMNKIDRLTVTETNYHNLLCNRTSNPFWKSVIKSYITWYTQFKNCKEIESKDQLIWGNPDVVIPFNEKLFLNNFIYVKDLYDIQGTPLSIEQMEARTGSRIMFTEYIGLWSAIPRTWKNEGITNERNYNIDKPINIRTLTMDKKGTINIRKILHEQTQGIMPTGQQKWVEDFNLDENTDWKYLYTLTKQCKLNARASYFHFQILHRTLITNRKLFQFSIKDNDQCE